MACPVCVVGGVVAISCRYLGLPDAISAHLVGGFFGAFAVVLFIKAKNNRKLPKYSAVLMWVVFMLLGILSLKLVGMW